MREALLSEYLGGTGTPGTSSIHGTQNQGEENRILPSVQRGKSRGRRGPRQERRERKSL